MTDLKAFASRRLNAIEPANLAPIPKRWTRHGSTRWLWNRDDIDSQGEPIFEAQ